MKILAKAWDIVWLTLWVAFFFCLGCIIVDKAIAVTCDPAPTVLFNNEATNELGVTGNCTKDDGSQVSVFGFQVPVNSDKSVIIQSLIESGQLQSMVELLISGKCYKQGNLWVCVSE